ncbi:MAG TPA: hypothetical protein VFB50_05645 [Chloroflexota bacterium]|nr:hypothetical protein [Chloroflexota bacterium]
MGRPSKRTPEVERRLLDALRAGNTRPHAARYAGIHEDTIVNWMRRSSAFSAAVEKAEADAITRHVANIAKAANDGQWTASAWWLERRYPNDYGRRDRIEVQVRQEAERLAAEMGLDTAEIVELAQRIAHGQY